ncbi:hypothetical protein LTS08_004820 [Lithohypha guttulata]|uniref:Uncharacterized protein n=1 Tax=Lithohypha guttulata TaxID=1690604 RepID=A0AAN7T259_9EURO|nr:hypothetical protein LTR05_002338 [Lithohypha guttulata]KAK5101213.1 hypothetical protein LTS08_004820 [Lithohypha guttulata]
MAEIGLNVYQVIQNELLAREGDRQSLGLGFRLAIIEIKITNCENTARNGRIWKLNHAISPLKALTPDARRAAKAQERKLLRQRGRDSHRDPKDPTKLIRDEEIWEIAEFFPRTLLDFKELQFSPAKVRDLMEFYSVKAYTPDQRLIDIHPDDELRDVGLNLETCMEELAMCWGLNWHKIEGLALPQRARSDPSADLHFPPPPGPGPGPGYFSPPPRASTYNI